MDYIIVEEATNKVMFSTDYDLELEAKVEELEVADVEFTIYERTEKGGWEESEFHCEHFQGLVTSHGYMEERCENMSDRPGGCWNHRGLY